MDEKLSKNICWVYIACIYTMKSLCRSSPDELPWLWLTFAQTSEAHEMQSQIALNAKPHGIFVLQLKKIFFIIRVQMQVFARLYSLRCTLCSLLLGPGRLESFLAGQFRAA